MGQTKRSLSTRFSKHLRSIRNADTPVGSHFSLPNHLPSELCISGLVFAPTIEEKRLQLESRIISNLRSDAPPGLNSRICFLDN